MITFNGLINTAVDVPVSEPAAIAVVLAGIGLVGIDRRWRMVQVFNQAHQIDKITLIREQRQGTIAPERPLLTISDLLGTWQGSSITSYPDDQLPITSDTKSTFSVSNGGYQWAENEGSIDLKVTSDRLLEFQQTNQSYQIL